MTSGQTTSRHLLLARRAARWWLPCGVALAVLLAGCMGSGEDTEPTAVPSAPTATPTIPAIVYTATPEPTPTLPPSLVALLDPGPTAHGVTEVIFMNSGDLWTIDSEGAARALTGDMTIEAWATTVSGGLAAVVESRRDGDIESQQVRFVSSAGQITGAIYGPFPTTGPEAQPGIVELAWSWDSSSLLILRADGSIDELIGLDDPFVDSSRPTRVIEAGQGETSSVAWGPTGDGIAFLRSRPGGGRSLTIAPEGVEPFDALAAGGGVGRSVSAYAWLPGRGRIAFVEDSPVPGARAPASIFTVAPDGSGLQLLVSASQFAPAATIGKLNASPDGRELAFFVYMPDSRGTASFQSLWVLTIDSGELREITIDAGYVVTDTWHMENGLLWRGIDLGAVAGDGPVEYTGVEPFILALTNSEGQTTVVFQSTLAGGE